MPKYFYTAKSLRGENKTGVLEAKDTHQLAQILRQEGFILINAELGSGIKENKLEISLPSFGVPLSEKLFFTRNLQVMISAGLPLPRAIQTLASQTKSKKFKNVLSGIAQSINKGGSFSDAISNYPDVFSSLFLGMIKAGEESGTLEESLKALAQQMEKENELHSRIQGAMIYPAVIILAMIGIGILMLIMVVPKLAETFKELDIELPLTTKIVIGLATFLSQKWYLAIIILAFIIFFFWQLSKLRVGKKVIDSLTLKIPVVSSLVKKLNSAYTVRTLSSLISAGVPLPRSLEIVSGTLGNVFYKEAVTEAAKRIRKGEKLSEVFSAYTKIYPSNVIQMIAIGEETGETSSVLVKLAEFYEEEVANATKNLVSVIEPVLMIIIGSIVGFFAISMVQPMYSMLGAIK